LTIIVISGILFQRIQNKLNDYYTLVSEASNDRIKSLKQIISSITMIKNSGLEDLFIERVCKLREREMELTNEENRLQSISNTLWFATSSFVIISIFGVYVVYDFEMKTSIAITVITLLQMLTENLLEIPYSIRF
jgi:ABC-type bacteriocin/lantibiotic exporter with double-glycine peptidase domain